MGFVGSGKGEIGDKEKGIGETSRLATHFSYPLFPYSQKLPPELHGGFQAHAIRVALGKVTLHRVCV